jgi:MioC protein
MAAIHIIVGSVMGTALEVAQAVQQIFSAAGHDVRVNADFRKGQLDENPGEVILICTSNTGMGDLPLNIVPFYEHLKNDFPRIAGRRYGVINLGDSSYPNFAQAGKTLDDAMADLGAQRIGEPLVLDAIYSDDPAAEARTWAQDWSELI